MISVALDDLEMWWAIGNAGSWTIVTETIRLGSLEIAARPPQLGSTVTQLAVCRVEGETVVIVFAHVPPLALDARHSLAAAVREEFDGAAVLVVLETAEGRLRVDTSFCERDAAQRALAFSLAAIVQASWAWDESERIRIESAQEFVEVEPRVIEKRWHATIVSRGRL